MHNHYVTCAYMHISYFIIKSEVSPTFYCSCLWWVKGVGCMCLKAHGGMMKENLMAIKCIYTVTLSYRHNLIIIYIYIWTSRQHTCTCTILEYYWYEDAWLSHFIVTECLFWKVSNLNVLWLHKGAVLGRTLKVMLALDTVGNQCTNQSLLKHIYTRGGRLDDIVNV